jgi:HD superfamily phosphohydrolase
MQRLDINKNGINGWYCTETNLYNDILRVQCQYCNEMRDASLEQTAIKVEMRRSGLLAEFEELTIMADSNADERELHTDFFSRWSIEAENEVSQLSDADLTAWIRQMEHIVLKGKTKLIKAKQVERERKAKNKPWLVPSNDDIDVNESIKQVKTRQERMSKIDKVNKMLSGMLGVAGAAELVKNIVSKATDEQVKNIKLVTPKDELVEQPKKDEPFDWSKLTG